MNDFEQMIRKALNNGLTMEQISGDLCDAMNKVEKEDKEKKAEAERKKKEKKEKEEVALRRAEAMEACRNIMSVASKKSDWNYDSVSAAAALVAARENLDWTCTDIATYRAAVREALEYSASLIKPLTQKNKHFSVTFKDNDSFADALKRFSDWIDSL